MMGLLDSLNSRDGIFALSLLDAASPKPVRTSIGTGLMQALMQSNAFQDLQDKKKQEEEDRKQRAAMQALQMQQIQQALAAQQTQQQELARQRQLEQQFRDKIPSPGMQASSAALGGGGGPTVENAARIAPVDPLMQLSYEAMRLGQIKPTDYISGLRKDETPLVVGEGAAVLRNGRPVFKNDKAPDLNSLIVMGPDGKPMLNQMLLDAKRQIASAGATQIGMPKIEVKTGESIAGQVGPIMKDSRAQADAGLRLVDSANRVLDAAEKGNLFAGPGANLLLKGAQIADVLGLGGKDIKEKIANTRNVVRGMAEQAVSARAQLGGQAQISNSEQELLTKATSGDIADLTAGEVVQIAQLNDRLGRMLYSNHQRQMQVMQQRPDLQGVAPFYAVPELPKPRATVVRTGRDKSGRRVQQMSDGTIKYVED